MINPADIFLPIQPVQAKSMPFQMIYKPVEMFFFPVLFSACLYVTDFWLLFNLPFGDTTLSLFLQAFLIGALAVPIIGFWAINQHGSFVIGADKKGIYYREMDNKSQFFLISWSAVDKISVNESSKRTLVIETTYNKFKKDRLPLPCNGSVYFLDQGTICLEFNTSFWYKKASIINNLSELRRRHALSKGQLSKT